MALKVETSVVAGLATAALVYSIYSNATPTIADIRVAKPHDADIESSRKLAAWTSAGVVAGISLIAKDGNIFVMGGVMVIILDWWHRHANEVNPMVARATAPDAIPVATQESDPGAYGYDDAVVMA